MKRAYISALALVLVLVGTVLAQQTVLEPGTYVVPQPPPPERIEVPVPLDARLDLSGGGVWVVTAGDTPVGRYASEPEAVAAAGNYLLAQGDPGVTVTITPDPLLLRLLAPNNGDAVVEPDPPSTGFYEPEPAPLTDTYIDAVNITVNGQVVMPTTQENVDNVLAGFANVYFKRGEVFRFAIDIGRGNKYVGYYGTGPAPIFRPTGYGSDPIIETKFDSCDWFVLQGLHVDGRPDGETFAPPDNRDGIIVRLLGADDGTGALRLKNVLIEDCRSQHVRRCLALVDDWARSQGPTTSGRLQVTARRNILWKSAMGPGHTHATGIYAEGLATGSVIEQNVIWRSGWIEDRNADNMSGSVYKSPSNNPDKYGDLEGTPRPQADRRSHNIYAQSFNGAIIVRDNWLLEPAANPVQLRAGGTLTGNVAWGFAADFGVRRRPSVVSRNVIFNQVDISSKHIEDRRGVGFQCDTNAGGTVYTGNFAWGRNGSLSRGGIEMFSPASSSGNYVSAWKYAAQNAHTYNFPDAASEDADNFVTDVDLSGVLPTFASYGGTATDRAFIEGVLIARAPGVWQDIHHPATFIDAVEAAWLAWLATP